MNSDTPVTPELFHDGFEILNGFFDSEISCELTAELEEEIASIQTARAGGVRFPHLKSRLISRLVESDKLRNLITPICGGDFVLIRSILFDKREDANWLIPWHQDLTIAVSERLEIDGFGSWSEKDGVTHVHAPENVLEDILTVRIHLDDCPSDNGALRVIPGSHKLGRIKKDTINKISKSNKATICALSRGGVLLMRPLLVHSSLPSKLPNHRRVLHLEFTSQQLPGNLQWIDS